MLERYTHSWVSLLEVEVHETEWAIHRGWVIHGDLGGSPQPFLHHTRYSMQFMSRTDLKQANSFLLVSDAPKEGISARRGNCHASNILGDGQGLMARDTGNKGHVVLSQKGTHRFKSYFH